MRNRLDYVSKEIGKKALSPFGLTTTQDEIHPETQYADLRHEPDPTRQGERTRAGLLGELASRPCLIEAYSRAPNGAEFRACLAKHLAAWQQRVRKARSESRTPEPQPSNDSTASFLWILAASAPTTLLTKLKFEPAPSGPTGIYLFGDDILRVGLVVTSELPRDNTTILVRLMAAGPLLESVIKEIRVLPLEAYERSVAEPILVQFENMFGQNPSEDPDELEFIMAMRKSWEETKAEGRAEGSAETLADALLLLLRARGMAVPDATQARILATKELRLLKGWFEKAITASTITDVIDDAS